MTTAHRPTWKAAVGRAQEGGWGAGGAVSTLSSVRDVASHTKLKLRAGPQAVGDRSEALRESLRKLEEAEALRKKALSGRRSGLLTRGEADPEEEEASRRKLLTQTADVDEEKLRAKYDDEDEDGGGGSDDDGGGWSDLEDGDGGGVGPAGPGAVDGDNGSDLDASDSDDESSSDEDDSDDEDEEAALQAELAKIRAEREAAKAKVEAEREAEEQARMEEAALTGNPLLSSSDGGGGGVASSGKMKRRWNDDVVFRNQARDEPDRAGKRRFINDTVRNDFHRRFLNKFVR